MEAFDVAEFYPLIASDEGPPFGSEVRAIVPFTDEIAQALVLAWMSDN